MMRCEAIGLKQLDGSFPHPPSVGLRAKDGRRGRSFVLSTCLCT